MGYAFGDTSLAARRLRLLAETFSESSRMFMREAADRHLGLAADLGCGPGYTTHLLADTLFPRHTVGLDNSESFVGLARSTASETVSFRLHDIKTEPFPSAPYDLLFSRFVLTHLPSPETIVDLWGRQLNVHGLLLIGGGRAYRHLQLCVRLVHQHPAGNAGGTGQHPLHRVQTRPDR